MNFFWDDDHREEIPLDPTEDAIHLWAAMLADGIEEWLDELEFREHQVEETL